VVGARYCVDKIGRVLWVGSGFEINERIRNWAERTLNFGLNLPARDILVGDVHRDSNGCWM
jgi:hypothetical protein